MSNPTEKLGFGKNPEATQRMIGELVLAARREEPPPRWKDLEKRYRRSRWMLRRYASLAERAAAREGKDGAGGADAPLAPKTA